MFEGAGGLRVTNKALPMYFGATLPLEIWILLLLTEVQVSEKLPYDM